VVVEMSGQEIIYPSDGLATQVVPLSTGSAYASVTGLVVPVPPNCRKLRVRGGGAAFYDAAATGKLYIQNMDLTLLFYGGPGQTLMQLGGTSLAPTLDYFTAPPNNTTFLTQNQLSLAPRYQFELDLTHFTMPSKLTAVAAFAEGAVGNSDGAAAHTLTMLVVAWFGLEF
jgi:hypothetical protein